jgi:hypothetical protein
MHPHKPQKCSGLRHKKARFSAAQRQLNLAVYFSARKRRNRFRSVASATIEIARKLNRRSRDCIGHSRANRALKYTAKLNRRCAARSCADPVNP